MILNQYLVFVADGKYFQEFMLATNTSDSESAEEKLRWAFRLYDKDSSGPLNIQHTCLLFILLFELLQAQLIAKS